MLVGLARQQVLDNVPDALVGSKFWVFQLPTEKPLGLNETDYSNVKVRLFQPDLEEVAIVEETAVGYFSVGKLGCLLGGLLSIQDFRMALTSEDIAVAQATAFQTMVEKKNQAVELVEKEVQLKRQKSLDRVEDQVAMVERLQTKLEGVSKELMVWKTIWQYVLKGNAKIEGNRPKKEGETWKAYFLEVTGNADIVASGCPAIFDLEDLPLETMLLKLAEMVSKLDKTKQLQESMVKRNEDKLARLKVAKTKQDERKVRKVQTKMDPEHAGVEQMDAIAYQDPAPEPEAGSNVHLPALADLNHQDDGDDDGVYMTGVDGDDDEECEDEQMQFIEAEETADGGEKPAASVHVHVPASFFSREVFTRLKGEGLVQLPKTLGLTLSYHASSQQWHARWLSRGLNYAPKWGAKRSEMMSLLMALRQLCDWHLSINADDAESRDLKDRLQAKINEVGF
eukprot:Skav204199  [mRNA]  locus=scaffold3425:108725:116221:+ [translate_table: standard]